MSWRPEFFFKSENKWYGNGLRFATKEECDVNARDKFMAWTMPSDWRSTECEDPVNYAYHEGVLSPVKAP